jgi:hypothetical protein
VAAVQRANQADSQGLVALGATAEVARRQPDGTWLWVIDQPRIVA